MKHLYRNTEESESNTVVMCSSSIQCKNIHALIQYFMVLLIWKVFYVLVLKFPIQFQNVIYSL